MKEYWTKHLDREAPWATHLAKLLGEELYQFVPLGLYGDACRIRHVTHQTPQKAFGLFMNCPLFRPYSSYASRWLLFSIDESLLYKHHTMNTILARITWSFNLLFEDRHPSTGCWGQPLTPKQEKCKGLPITGQKFVVCELRGDWKHIKDVWRVQSSWKAGVNMPVCYLCPAFGTGASRYYNIKEDSPLWQMQYSMTQFLREQMPERGPCHLVERQRGVFGFDQKQWLRPADPFEGVASYYASLLLDACCKPRIAVGGQRIIAATGLQGWGMVDHAPELPS